MLSEEALKTIRNAVKFKYDEHVSRLLAIPEKHLNKIVPNKSLPLIEMLEGLNADTAEEVRRYGEVLRTELARIVGNLGVDEFTGKDKELTLQVIEEFFLSDIYKKRFEIMVGSIERKVENYGIAFDIKGYRVDIPKSCCDIDAENSIRKLKEIIANELSCHVVHNQTKPESEENAEFQDTTEKDSQLSVPNLSRKIGEGHVLGANAVQWTAFGVIVALIFGVIGVATSYFVWRHPVSNSSSTSPVASLKNDISQTPFAQTQPAQIPEPPTHKSEESNILYADISGDANTIRFIPSNSATFNDISIDGDLGAHVVSVPTDVTVHATLSGDNNLIYTSRAVAFNVVSDNGDGNKTINSK